MSKFNLIDMKNYERIEYYNHYKDQLNCSYSTTLPINISNLKTFCTDSNIKFYPAMIYAIMHAVNMVEEFRMELDEDGKLGIWESMEPCYTMLNKNTNLHYSIHTPLENNILTFNDNYIEDLKYNTVGGMEPKSSNYKNLINISSLPWFSFTGFNINADSKMNYFLPFFTLGKYYEENNEWFIPLSIQVHHAVCDGYHVSKFIDALNDFITNITQD